MIELEYVVSIMIKMIKAKKNASNWGNHPFLQGQLPQSPKKAQWIIEL